ncbi:hypothetical protein [Lichenifustis flavocetrariae]|uniref:Uncharacterized protein n=1 Tax=Lichenifustis flavocetrariae TaxID=2949735 RepID=A0AA41YTT9_9HYPH|nr:hypothetical protein [Lichenifustis flavocetrariae]MCW6508459.1 hypothetical protein [Lichenifustis flavocetrariae]
MMTNYVSHLKANEDAAALARQEQISVREQRDRLEASGRQWVDSMYREKDKAEDRAESARLKAREILAPVLQMQEADDDDIAALVWALVQHSAGMLALCELDEPADLKIRRLGRVMQSDAIIF